MGLTDARGFLLASYHDLPNILLIGSLLLGSLMGYLPLVWVAFGLLMNNAFVFFLQWVFFTVARKFTGLQRYIFGPESATCMIGFQDVLQKYVSGSREGVNVTPSYWMSAAAFFAVFSIYNSVQVTAKEPASNVDKKKVATRRAFSISALVIGLVFLGLVLARGFTGCETLLGGTTGVVFGGAWAIAFWHILDACGTGKVPDILQVVGSMAPEGSGKPTTPVMCVPPKEA